MASTAKFAQAVRIGIDGAFYSLAHVPELVRYGSKPARELKAHPEFQEKLHKRLRRFEAATAYAPHQVYIGNLKPQALSKLAKPWYQHLLNGATAQGRFGDIVDQRRFYCMLVAADQFDLVTLEKKWSEAQSGNLAGGRAARLQSSQEIESRCANGALPLYDGGQLVGAFEAAHPEDANLAADVLLENLATKATAAHALCSLLRALKIDPRDIDVVISCSEEAVGDRYNRGGGNMAKAVAEEVGCENASGFDVKAFCAGPMYAMAHGASLICAGLGRYVAIVAGGSLAKLGMKFSAHWNKNMPVLEDVLGSVAVLLSRPKPDAPCLRLDTATFHPVRAGASPQAMAECLAEEPLARVGMKLTDVDRYGVELHNPEITVPSGSGDVPRANYLTLAALAVMRGQIRKEEMQDFTRHRGMVGYAPTQGHIPSAIAYLGHALDDLRSGEIRNAMLIAKGSLFLGRMTQLSDGCSFLLDRNQD